MEYIGTQLLVWRSMAGRLISDKIVVVVHAFLWSYNDVPYGTQVPTVW